MPGKKSKPALVSYLAAVGALCAIVFAAPDVQAAPKTKFWNTTGDTIVKFELAPAGTTTWGPDQCKNDRDDSVDDDERLLIVGVASGTYDARMTYKNGAVCMAKSVKVVEGKIFSIEKKDLTNCTKP
ncbi:MAG TPA: hypothetical protein VGB93_07585 [Methylovirgula sp.]